MILDTIGSLGLAAIAGGVGWAATEFVARPIRRFFDLRGEVIRRMAQYAILTVQTDKEGHEVEIAVTEDAFREAESVTRDLAAQMLAFAYNETFARSILVHVLRYDPREASEGLFAISWNTRAGSSLTNPPRERVAKALRIDRSILL